MYSMNEVNSLCLYFTLRALDYAFILFRFCVVSSLSLTVSYCGTL